MNEFNRCIFTTRPSLKDKALDFLTACLLAAALTVGALAYFDILVK